VSTEFWSQLESCLLDFVASEGSQVIDLTDSPEMGSQGMFMSRVALIVITKRVLAWKALTFQ
jgi:hypothetical protein